MAVPARVEAADLARPIHLGRGGPQQPADPRHRALERFGFLHRVSVNKVAAYTEVPGPKPPGPHL